MKQRFAIYLRTHRRRWGLTQKELAQLIGLESGTHVSRLEHGKRQPTFRVVASCLVVFGVKAAELFPSVVKEVEDEVVRRAYELYLDLQGDPSPTTKTKLNFLEALRARAMERGDGHEV